jgi:zinc/manganese transport system substrate-binding protein
VIDVQQLLGLADGANPHVWYDPGTMPKVARAVADALETLQPDSKATDRGEPRRRTSTRLPR